MHSKPAISSTATYRAVRDTDLAVGLPRRVLKELIMHGKAYSQFRCSPSYEQLAYYSDMSRSSVRRAIESLVEAKLISITPRRRKSNIYHVNVPLIMQAYEKKRVEVLPFAENPSPVDDTGVLDETNGGKETMALVEDVIAEAWPDHPFLKHPRWREFLAKDLAACVEISGVLDCASLLRYIASREPAISKHIAESKYLGKYIAGSWPQWLEQFHFTEEKMNDMFEKEEDNDFIDDQY